MKKELDEKLSEISNLTDEKAALAAKCTDLQG